MAKYEELGASPTRQNPDSKLTELPTSASDLTSLIMRLGGVYETRCDSKDHIGYLLDASIDEQKHPITFALLEYARVLIFGEEHAEA